MPELWVILIAFGAAARITRLLTDDTITKPLRDRIINRYGTASLIVEFIHCPWCVGFWVSAAIAPLVLEPSIAASRWFQAPALAFTMSYLVAMTAKWFDRRNPKHQD